MNKTIAIAIITAVCACSPQTEQSQGTQQENAAASSQNEPPGSFSREQFAQLKWLEGDWRGTTPDGKPFFERHRVTSDSTIDMYTFADSSMAQAVDSSRIYWRDNHIYTGSEGARSVVTRIDTAGVRFVPEGTGGHHFTWKQTAEGWTATLGQAGNVVYQMRPVRR